MFLAAFVIVLAIVCPKLVKALLMLIVGGSLLGITSIFF
jgi:hypothetical protein